MPRRPRSHAWILLLVLPFWFGCFGWRRVPGVVQNPPRLLYVALSGSPIGGPGVDESTLPPADRTADGIGVVDISERRLVRTFRSGIDPEAFGLSPDGRMLYVSNEDSAEMSAVDLGGGDVQWHVRSATSPKAWPYDRTTK